MLRFGNSTWSTIIVALFKYARDAPACVSVFVVKRKPQAVTMTTAEFREHRMQRHGTASQRASAVYLECCSSINPDSTYVRTTRFLIRIFLCKRFLLKVRSRNYPRGRPLLTGVAYKRQFASVDEV